MKREFQGNSRRDYAVHPYWSEFVSGRILVGCADTFAWSLNVGLKPERKNVKRYDAG
jgi:hypothetical protein